MSFQDMGSFSRHQSSTRFHFQQSELGTDAADSGKSTESAAGRDDTMAWDDKRHSIACHDIPDRAGRQWRACSTRNLTVAERFSIGNVATDLNDPSLESSHVTLIDFDTSKIDGQAIGIVTQ